MSKKIAIDFDLTVILSEYYEGKTTFIKDNEGAVDVLKRLINAGHQLFLFTCRDKKNLKEAVKWFEDKGIKLSGINEDPNSLTTSPKVRCDLYIDDKSLGAPLKYAVKMNKNGDFADHGEGYIDWVQVNNFLKRNNYY